MNKSAVKAMDQFCIADPNIESTWGLLAFPWVAKDLDSSLVMTYHDGRDGPGVGNTYTRMKKSYDQGLTWTPGVIVWDDALDTGANICILSNGDYLLTSQGYVNNVPNGLYTLRSTDHGATWGLSVLVQTGLYTSTAALQTASGRLLWPVYTGGAASVSKLLVSDDQGLTWYAGSVVCGGLPNGTCATETTMVQFPDGTIIGLTRCTDFQVRLSLSTDDGVTWSAPGILFGNCESRIDWVRLQSGRIVLGYRDHDTGCEMLRWSDDNLATVTAPVLIHGPDSRTSYSALIEVSPNQVLAVIGEIDDTEANGRLMGRYLVSAKDSVIPSGQATYQSALRLAAGDNSIIAWDNFGRPDNLQGLGSADSGHQWVPYGGKANNDWKMLNGVATNANHSGITAITMNTGNTSGYVEAQMKWAGATSSPIGLVALRSTSTGHALWAKLDSNGGIARISWFDGTIHDLAATPSGLKYKQNIWYKFKLIVKGDLVIFKIDDREVLSYTLTSTDHTNLDGGTMWGLLGGGLNITYIARSIVVADC